MGADVKGMNMDDSIENEEIQQIENDQPESRQQYEGDDLSALATAKQRMQERDAEYAAKFKSLTEEQPKKSAPVAKKKATEQKPVVAKKAESKPVPAYAEDAPSVEKREDKPAMTAPVIKDAADKIKGAVSKAGSVSSKEVSGGLRGLNGGSSVPSGESADRAEYIRAWKRL